MAKAAYPPRHCLNQTKRRFGERKLLEWQEGANTGWRLGTVLRSIGRHFKRVWGFVLKHYLTRKHNFVLQINSFSLILTFLPGGGRWRPPLPLPCTPRAELTIWLGEAHPISQHLYYSRRYACIFTYYFLTIFFCKVCKFNLCSTCIPRSIKKWCICNYPFCNYVNLFADFKQP